MGLSVNNKLLFGILLVTGSLITLLLVRKNSCDEKLSRENICNTGMLFPETTQNYGTDLNCTSFEEMEPTLCIETNICKHNKLAGYYIYCRNDKFQHILHSPVNYTNNITHDERVVPSLVHFTWFTSLSPKKKPFRFEFLVAVLAVHRFVKPHRIFLWIDLVPDGKYFNEMLQKVPELYLIRRERPKEIYGRPVNVPEHVSDIVRLEVMLEFGGMYFDLDVIVVNPLDPLLKYEMVMGYELDTSLCNSVLIAAAGADFLKIWHSNYKTFNDKQWAEHSVVLPAKLAKKYTQLIHTEKRSLNRPNWTGKEISQLYGVGNKFDWKKNNYVIHYWHKRQPKEFNPENIKRENTTIGEIFRYIYYGNSNIIK